MCKTQVLEKSWWMTSVGRWLPLVVAACRVDSGGCGPDSSLCSFYRRCDRRGWWQAHRTTLRGREGRQEFEEPNRGRISRLSEQQMYVWWMFVSRLYVCWTLTTEGREQGWNRPDMWQQTRPRQRHIIDWREHSSTLTWCREGTQSLTQWELPEFSACSGCLHLGEGEKETNHCHGLLSPLMLFRKEVIIVRCCDQAMSDKSGWGWAQRTPATSVFPPHHHVLVLFSSREEGHRLAQAEAAFSARVVLHLGALHTDFITQDLHCICTQTLNTRRIASSPRPVCWAHLLCLSSGFSLSSVPMRLFETLWGDWPLGAAQAGDGAGLL